jgi:outer membrane protein
MKRCKLTLFLLLPLGLWAQPAYLSLKEAIQTAIENNFAVVMAKNDAEAAAIANNWANAGALPTATITAGRGYASNNLQQDLANGTVIKRNAAATNNLNTGIALSWRFFDGWRMYAAKKRLEELEKLGQTEVVRMVNETVLNVTTAYYTLIRLQQQLKAIHETITLFEERLRLAEARFNIGTSAKTDALQARVDLNEQQSGLLNTEIEILQTRTGLNVLLARDPAIDFRTDTAFVVQNDIDIATLRQQTEAQNPAVLAAQHQLAILLQTRREINAQRLPSATLNGNYGFNRNRNAAGFTLLNQTYGPSASIGINIPIFVGGFVKKQLQVADLDIKNQQLAEQQLKNQLLGSVTNAYNEYLNAKKAIALEEQNLLVIAENNSINAERFKKLSITSVEWRQGQLNYTDALTRRINASFRSAIAVATLQVLAGKPVF